MKVSELIELLNTQDPDDPIMLVYDGSPRLSPEKVWKSAEGTVLITGDYEMVYKSEDRPEGAPTSAQHRYWDTSEISS